MGFGVEDKRFRSYGLGFRVQGVWCMVGVDFGGSGVEGFPEPWNWVFKAQVSVSRVYCQGHPDVK